MEGYIRMVQGMKHFGMERFEMRHFFILQIVMVIDIGVTEPSSETKEFYTQPEFGMHVAYVSNTEKILINYREKKKKNQILVLIMTEPDWKYDNCIYALQK